MRTEDFKRGVAPILLVFALVFSMILVAPLASPGDLIYDPGGEIIEIAQGDNFLIRHRLEWDEPEDGSYSITIAWVNNENKPFENFTFLSAEAYFDLDNDNLPDSGLDPILAVVTLRSNPAGGNTNWALSVKYPVGGKDSRNGQFNVDIWMGAYGVGGVPHIPGDHVIPWQFGGIIIVEKFPQNWNRDPITIRMGGRGVRVISPENQSGLPEETLTFTVTVQNIGDLNDTYDLTVSDDAGWGPTVLPTSLALASKAQGEATLTVTIPENATLGTMDNITVTATSQADDRVSAENLCIAHATGVDVSISPSYQSKPPGENLEYTVTVKNHGTTNDNYDLVVSDNAGWGLTLSDNLLDNVPPDEDMTVTLSVTIPENAIPGTQDNITVTAVSQTDNTVTDSDSCIAQARIDREVEVSVSPSENIGLGGENLTYTVTVANTGNVSDTYALENTDTMGWPLSLENTSLEVPENENRTTTLTVTIPVDAAGGTEDTVTVTATSVENENVSDNASCIAHVTTRTGVDVEISPDNLSDVPGAPLTYTVTVTNAGVENDTYVLDVSDNAIPSWGPTLSDYRLENVQPGDNRTITLSVTIPENAVPSTEDNLIVTATSQTDTTVSDNASCIAHSKWREITFYPIDDAEVLGATPDTNYGTSGYMRIGYEDNAIRVFLKFKPENIPADATIESVKLYLETPFVKSGGENVQVHRVDNDDWDEDTITWSNQPSIGKFLDNRNCSASLKWYYWDVTRFVASQWENENDRVASFGMVGAGENDPPTHYAEFFSKERVERHLRPFLRVFYRTSANSFSVSISPSSQSALPGRTLNYTVMVKNVGWENGTYSLENRDDAGWDMTLDNVQFENVPPGENRKATLTVTIPDNASSGTRDNITVTATLMENENIRGYASGVAHSTLPAVEVTITPSENSGVPRWTLTYEVMVKNVGVENDNYSLKVIDNGYWRLTLDNSLLENVPPGGYKTTHLRITIPVGLPPSTEDEITVTATSMENNTVQNSASCIARVSFAAVMVSITPENQSGLKEAMLTYIVTIRNTGNVEDTYDLSVSDNENWGSTLSENLLVVQAGKNEQATLSVTVPSDAAENELTRITVIATSRADPTVSDSASSIAHSGFAAFGVSITPENQDGEADYNILGGFDLEYTVTVANKGTITDTYTLTVSSENADWSLLLSDLLDNTLVVQGGENGTATLYVKIPLDSIRLSTSNISVTATSQADNTVSYASCVARVAIVDFEVSLSPSYQKAMLGEDLSYILTITNTGTGALPKIHVWSLSDNENWIPENVYQDEETAVPADESKDDYLTVRVSDNASRDTRDNLTVEVKTFSHHTGTWITKETSAIAHATTLKHEVLILASMPKLKEGKPGDNVAFSVMVRNIGLESDTYDLTVVDDALPSWNWRFDDNPLNVENGRNRSTTLRVTIPDSAPPDMKDNLMVIATSRKDPTLSESDNCIVLVENFRGVEVSVSPEDKSGSPEETLTYNVTVTNTSNISDNYDLTASDDADWGATLAQNLLTIPAGGSRTTTVSVTVPSDAAEDELTRITVIATSRADPTVSDSATCIASADVGGVEVSISPPDDSAEPGRTLTFTVTVTNTGSVLNNYTLTVSDNAGWGATLTQNLLTIPAAGSRTTTVSVTVPSDAVENELTQITVVATSQAAPIVSDSFTCRATAKSLVTKGTPLAVPLAISAFLIGAAIIVPAYLLRGRPRKAVQPTLFRERRRLGVISAMANLLRGRRKKARRRVFSFSS